MQPSPVKDVSEAVAEFVATAVSGEDAGNVRLYRIVAGKVEGRDGYVGDGVKRTRLRECQGWIEVRAATVRSERHEERTA